MAYLYRHIRLDKNEPFYIGIGSDDNFKRAYAKCSRNKYWINITAKTDYDVDIMINDIELDEAKRKEIEFISFYKRKLDGGILCNITTGGESAKGLVRSKENIEKLAKYLTGKKRPKEIGDKISFKLKGIKRSDEFKEVTRKRMIGNSYTAGIKLNQEHKDKISIANKGKKKPITECPYCGIIGAIPVLKRFHFDNCKNK
jgi:hypothetical protein